MKVWQVNITTYKGFWIYHNSRYNMVLAVLYLEGESIPFANSDYAYSYINQYWQAEWKRLTTIE